MHHSLVSVWVCLFRSVCLCVCLLDFDFQTCVDLSKKITLALSKSQAQSAAFSSASTLVVHVTDIKPYQRYGNYLLFTGKHNDDDVYLRRELLMTMMVIRIAMMTAVFMGRHTNKLERLSLREGVPSYARVHTYLAGLYSIIKL